MKIFPEISVIASHNLHKAKWALKRNYILYNKGKGLKIRSKADVQYEQYYFLAIRGLKYGTKAFCCPYDFSDAYHYYVKRLKKLQLKNTDDITNKNVSNYDLFKKI